MSRIIGAQIIDYKMERNNDGVSFSYVCDLENLDYWYNWLNEENNDETFSFSSSLNSETFPLRRNPGRWKTHGQGNVEWTLDYSWFPFTEVFAFGEPPVPLVMLSVAAL